MDKATEQLLSMGLPGIVIVALSIALMRLFKAYQESQEKRISEARESVGALERNTAALSALIEVVKERKGG